MVQPTAYVRRSFAWRKLQAAGAVFEEVAGAAVAVRYATTTDEDQTARRLGIAELSPLPRHGFKGLGTVDWLGANGLVVPKEPNWTAKQPDGSLALRLAMNEIFLLGDLKGHGRLGAELTDKWQAAGTPPASARGFPLPRQESHTWMLVAGEHSATLFAKICGVDLRPQHFADGQIAQTSVAKMSALVARADQGRTLAYHLLCDSASANYMWDCLLDAAAEFGGGPVGLRAMQGLAA